MKVYLYFESVAINIKTSTFCDDIRNVNLCLLPLDNLNSEGYWGYRTVMKRQKSSSGISDTLIMDQNWVDVNVFLFHIQKNGIQFGWDRELLYCIDKIITKLLETSIFGAELKEVIMDYRYGIDSLLKKLN